jgi:hypothetical protein
VLLAVVFVVDADADAAAADPEDAAAVCGKDATEGPPFEAAWSFIMLLYWGIALACASEVPVCCTVCSMRAARVGILYSTCNLVDPGILIIVTPAAQSLESTCMLAFAPFGRDERKYHSICRYVGICADITAYVDKSCTSTS